ncbi:ROK family transcriptional regulator [Planococcus sp. 107-1]|uniref:ROK family transcriptional regulator n=1 Tax=Planococcus sp. 107-1 TaxID=2908840 RepID=UPI001F1C1B96|nr:ROK family transcriptional regulator [Planococcus sp. 107-1]UJF26620.1 ROK family transcriptional regulator [Planococcus sp. 107-1]
MVTGDGSYIKQINRGLILQQIIEHGMISRADLSKKVGLNKATISVQAADLLDEELIYETQQEHRNLGRRPIMLSLNRQSGFALGIDLDAKDITYILSDLLGYPVHTETVPLETSDYDSILALLSAQIKKFQAQCADSHYGLIGVVIGVHGTVGKNEKVFFVPQHQWVDKELKADLEKEVDVAIQIQNNANASAFAEKVFTSQDSENLLSISMYSGMGLGIIMDGELLKGYNGFAGEMGHMIVVPGGKQCTCGNKGCWEMYASEARLLQNLADIKKKNKLSYDDVESWIAAEDKEVIQQIDEFFEFLAIGLNNIINLYNPETIVLNSQVLKMDPHAIERIESLLTSSVSQYRELKISELGKEACAMGACALAIKSFLKVPELRLDLSTEHLPADDYTETVS